MSQVQNNTLHNWVQPATFLAVAYFAGSKHFIQYFPGASRGGLLLAAGMGSAATLASPHIPTPDFLKTDQKNEHALHSLIRVTASLALGTLTAHFADKILKGRVSLCMHAAGRFIALETAVALLFAGYSVYTTSSTPGSGGGTPQTLEEKHAAYLKDLDSWNKLPEKERSDFAKKCFDKDLALLSIIEGDFDSKIFAELPKQDVGKLTPNQLEWFSAIYTRGLVLTVDQEFALNAARDAKGLNTTWVNVTEAHIKYAFSEAQATLLHEYYSNYADAWDALDHKTRGAFVLAWFKADLPVVSTEEKVCLDDFKKDRPDDISHLTENQLAWVIEFSAELNLDMEGQFTVNAALQGKGGEPVWNDDVNQDYVEYALGQNKATLLHGYFSENPLELALIEAKAEGITEAFNKACAASELAAIPDAHNILINLKPQEIDGLSKDEAHFASDYMFRKDTTTDFNKHLSPEQQLAYNAAFEKHDTKRFWIWPVVQRHVDFMATHDVSLARFHRKMTGAPIAFGAIPDAQQQALAQLFAGKSLATVADAREILQKLRLDDIGKLNHYEPEDWNEFFKTHPDQWKAKTVEDLLRQQAFCNKFKEFGIDTALTVQWPDPSNLERDSVESLLALHKNLPKAMQAALTQRLQELEEAEKKAAAAALPAFPKSQAEISKLSKEETEAFLARRDQGEQISKKLSTALEAHLKSVE